MQVPVQTGSAHLIAGSDLVIIDSGIAELGSEDPTARSMDLSVVLLTSNLLVKQTHASILSSHPFSKASTHFSSLAGNFAFSIR